MKKVLLTSTAVALTAGWASAADMSMSGSISLTYGAFGTGSLAAGADDFSSEADLDVTATSAGGAITMTGTLELDEDGDPATGPVTISSGALTFTYDANDLGALAMAPDGSVGGAGDDGEDNNYGDYSVAFSAGGIGVTYTKDQESSDNVTAVTYSSGALSLSMTATDETNGPVDDAAGLTYDEATDGGKETVVGATYVTGPYTIDISGNDAATQNWDASVALASGDTTVTIAADENNTMSVGIAYAAGGMSVSARQEFNDPTDDETEISLSYTEGALTFGAAYDSGQTNHFGDESILVISAGYTDGDVSIAAKGTDNDEMEVSVSFSF